jgi:hypothetical protein
LKGTPTHPLLILCVAMFGLLMMLPDLDHAWSGLPDGTWPTAEARVVASEVEAHSNYNSATHVHSTHYIARITYRYQHEGASYDSYWWNPGGSRSFADKQDAQAAVAASPAGASLTVHVNPRIPSRAVVDPTPPQDYGAWFVRGGIIIGIALLMLVVEIVRRRRST